MSLGLCVRIAACLLASLPCTLLAQPRRLIALSQSTAAGGPSDPTVGPFAITSTHTYPAISDEGVVTFGATTFADGSALWVNRNENNLPMFTMGAPVVEMPGFTYTTPRTPPFSFMSLGAQVLYVAGVQSPALTSVDALVLNTGSGPRLVTTEGAVAPGPPAGAVPFRFGTFNTYQARGDSVVFAGTFTGSPSGSGIWRSQNGLITNVMYAGQSVAAGRWHANPSLVGVADAGDVAFNSVASVTSSGSLNALDSVWIAPASGGAQQLIVQQGQPAPGTLPGTVYGRPSGGSSQLTRAVAQSSSGALAIYGELAGTQVSLTNDTGLWKHVGGATSLVAREGDHAPGFGTNAVFGQMPPVASINAPGHIAFAGSILDPEIPDTTRKALFTDAGGILRMQAQVGDEAPGLPGGTTFLAFGSMTLTNSDWLVFLAQTAPGTWGAWAARPTGEIIPIVVPGSQLVLGTTMITTRSVDWSLTNSSGKISINAQDELVLRLFTTTPGQMAIVTFAVPAPGTGLLLLGWVLAGNGRCRTRSPQRR